MIASITTTKKSIIEQFLSVHAEGIHLFVKNNADYGDAFATYGPIGLLLLIDDKIKCITKNGMQSESMRDTLIDIFNYSTMAIMLLDEDDEYKSNTDARFTQFASVNFDAMDLFIQKQTEYITQGGSGLIQLISHSADQIQQVLEITTSGITLDKSNHKMLRNILLNLCNYAVVTVMLYDDANRDANAADESTDEEELPSE
jgi:hypothetical protein